MRWLLTILIFALSCGSYDTNLTWSEKREGAKIIYQIGQSPNGKRVNMRRAVVRKHGSEILVATKNKPVLRIPVGREDFRIVQEEYKDFVYLANGEDAPRKTGIAWTLLLEIECGDDQN